MPIFNVFEPVSDSGSVYVFSNAGALWSAPNRPDE